jgi:hypothetical protein
MYILPADNDDKPGLDHYAIVLPNHKDDISGLKNHFANLGISTDETIPQSDRQYTSSLYVCDPDKIKIHFLIYLPYRIKI